MIAAVGLMDEIYKSIPDGGEKVKISGKIIEKYKELGPLNINILIDDNKV